MTEGEKKVGESNVVEGAPASKLPRRVTSTIEYQNVHELRQTERAEMSVTLLLSSVEKLATTF